MGRQLMVIGEQIRVFIVDDHPVVREGLRALLATQTDITVAGEAGTALEALSLFRRLRPDVTLLDLFLPDKPGWEVLAAIQREAPSSAVIILSSYGSDRDIRTCLKAGAAGYLLKDSPRNEIFAAIRSVTEGKDYISRCAKTRMAEPSRLDRLTRRQQDILELVADGFSNEEIAQRLGLTVGTVKAHIHSILSKLNVQNRAAAIAAALKRGLVRSRPGE